MEPPAIDAVVTHHRDGYRSGVARFNEVLAEHLGVPLVGLFEPEAFATSCPLFSFKFSELDEAERDALLRALDARPWRGELFLHELAGDPIEERLVRAARRVHCGNQEILEGVRGLTAAAGAVWTPGLIVDDRPFRPAEVTVFSFGMAHKIRTDIFRRLRELLDASGRTYAVYVSAANHETASLRDAELVFREMHEIFPHELYFLGNLSDVAVANYLRQTTFFAAFFASGVRDNNTSVASALERGCAVITNLDEHSPPELVHMDTVIDIRRCDELPLDDLVLARLRLRALEVARARTWTQLVSALTR
jgi:hypothetical protein